MARKNLLSGLIPDTVAPSSTDEAARQSRQEGAAPAAPRRARMTGAIGAVSQSIEALKARSVMNIDPDLIDAGGLQDRLETDDSEDAALLASIRSYGQQVPVLVRPHPESDGRYQIVYGRRRVLALRDLGQPVKALVRDLDDSALVMAQGQENNARRDLSFIEKANFAAQMRDAGYQRKAICDALNVDKTLISRMLSIVDRIGRDVIEAVGAAPSVGRDRWALLAGTIEEKSFATGQIIGSIALLSAPDTDSGQRFEAACRAVGIRGSTAKGAASAPVPTGAPGAGRRRLRSAATGIEIGSVLMRTDKVVLTLPRSGAGGFEDWLIENLEDIHNTWAQSGKDG